MVSTTESTLKKRIERMGNMDVLRCLAALAVVCIHVISGPVHVFNGMPNIALFQMLETIIKLMSWAVPVFFIMTGYFCGKHETYPYSFTFKKVKKFVIVLFTIGYFYALLECVYTTKQLGINEIGTAFLNVLNRKSWDHMWFVYDIIGVYLVLPLLHYFFSKTRESVILVLLLFLMSILCPWLGNNTIVNIDIGFPLGTQLFYVCFGMMLSMGYVEHISSRTRIIVSIILILSGVMAISILGVEQFGYGDLFACFMATGIIVLFLELRIPASKILESLAGCTWGVYLIHPFFINLATKYFNIDLLTGNVFGKLALFYIVIVFLSFLSVYILKHIPIIKSLF